MSNHKVSRVHVNCAVSGIVLGQNDGIPFSVIESCNVFSAAANSVAISIGGDRNVVTNNSLWGTNWSKGIEIKNTGRDNLYTLSFRDPNPGKAQRVVQSLVSIFVSFHSVLKL